MNLWQYYQDHWNFYHSVTFDGPNKLILVNQGVTELDVKEDIYSDWKEWFDHQNPDGLINAKYLPALRNTGGDPLPGNQYLGDTYFLINGWRIKPYQGSYALTINGNIYTEEGTTPIVDADGLRNNIRIEFTRSLLVQTVEVESTASVPTATEIAAAVWDKLVSAHTTAGTFGKIVQDTDDSVVSIEGKVDVIDSNIDILLTDSTSSDAKLDNIQSTVDTIDGKVDTLITDVGNIDLTTIENDLKRIAGLVHENIYIDQPVYDADDNLTSARVRIYSASGSVGTDNDVIGTYTITSTADGPNRFSIWKQVKI